MFDLFGDKLVNSFEAEKKKEKKRCICFLICTANNFMLESIISSVFLLKFLA